ncbi:hypothetical protein [Virgibacillus pantothenticus]|uniref:hypothetical protein n=1 Tax=Virgibacillus pantothenticus TaxID=1473 RepID=UPI000985CCED|nr:hypothetical protein [Virgibacillus pantothenticus]
MARRQKQKLMFHFLIFVCFFIGILLGLYGQELAYFLNEKVYVAIYPIYYLTASTITSISMFLVSLLFVYIAAKKKILSKTISSRYAWSIFISGFFISFWSMFVLAMWWG